MSWQTEEQIHTTLHYGPLDTAVKRFNGNGMGWPLKRTQNRNWLTDQSINAQNFERMYLMGNGMRVFLGSHHMFFKWHPIRHLGPLPWAQSEDHPPGRKLL